MKVCMGRTMGGEDRGGKGGKDSSHKECLKKSYRNLLFYNLHT